MSSFTSDKDKDVEFFLKNRAISFEKLGKSRTFLIFDEGSQENEILAYFTIAIKVLEIPNELSNRKIKALDGFSAKANGKVITSVPAILIGQLGKNSNAKNVDGVDGDSIMQFCMDTIFKGQQYLGGRIVTLDCKDIPYLRAFYEKYGFELAEMEYSKDDLLCYIQVLREKDIM